MSMLFEILTLVCKKMVQSEVRASQIHLRPGAKFDLESFVFMSFTEKHVTGRVAAVGGSRRWEVKIHIFVFTDCKNSRFQKN